MIFEEIEQVGIEQLDMFEAERPKRLKRMFRVNLSEAAKEVERIRGEIEEVKLRRERRRAAEGAAEAKAAEKNDEKPKTTERPEEKKPEGKPLPTMPWDVCDVPADVPLKPAGRTMWRFVEAPAALKKILSDHPEIAPGKVKYAIASLLRKAGITRAETHLFLLRSGISRGDETWQQVDEKIKRGDGGVGGIGTLKRAMASTGDDRLFSGWMNALESEAFSLVPREIHARMFRGYALCDRERFLLDTFLDFGRGLKTLKRRDPERPLEAVLRCGLFSATLRCAKHGRRGCVDCVCKKEICRHCRYRREGAKRAILTRTWPQTESWWLVKIPAVDGEVVLKETVEIGDDGLPRRRSRKGERRKRGKTKIERRRSTALADRVRQAYHQHPLLSRGTRKEDRWPAEIPHKAAFGYDHTLVVVPAEWTENATPIEPEKIAALVSRFGVDVELVSRAEAIDRIVIQQYTIAEVFDRWIWSGCADSCYEDLSSWLRTSSKSVAGNKLAQKFMPWPSSTTLQQFLIDQANLARNGRKVKFGECDALTEEKDPETGELLPCGMKYRVVHQKTSTGDVLETNSAGHILTGREVWRLADRKGWLLVDHPDLKKLTYASRGEIQEQRQRKMIAALAPPS